MTDNMKEASTPEYTMGYSEDFERIIRARTAATHASYLLPHLKPGMRVLDVGCGPGTISVGLAAAVDPGEFCGIDMEGSQVELAAKAASDGGHSNAHFRVADALDLPFPDDQFDGVHCHAVLTHIPDTTAALAEFNCVLKTGGILGAREFIGGLCFIEPDVGNLSRVFAVVSDVLTANGGHPQMGREIRTRISEAGFVDVEASGSFDSWGSPSDIAAYSSYLINYLLGPPIAAPAISHGIATREGFDGWRDAVLVWKDHPGAFSAWAFGEAIGRKR